MSYEPVTIREAAQVEVLLFVSLAFVGALGVVYWGFQTYQFGRLIRDTPPEPVSSLAMGRTEIVGTSLPADRIYDQPFTEGQCVYADFTVKEYRESNDDDDDDRWVTVQSETVSAPFYIDDGTGEMYVEPNDDTLYEVSDEYSTTISVGRRQSPPAPVQEFLGGSGSSDVLSSMSSSGTFGGVVDRVKGVFSRGEDDDEDVPSQLDEEELAAEEADDSEGPTHISRSALGSVSSTSRKRRYIQTVVPLEEETYVFGGATRRDPTEQSPGQDDVYMSTDPGTGEFIVSDKDEFELARTYRNRSALYIGSGLVASVALLALLAQILITGPLYGIEAAMP